MLRTYFENYAQYERILAPTQLVFFMLGIGATLTWRDFIRVVQRPQAVMLGAACQFILAPLIAWVIIRLADIDPGIAVGLVLISAMPSGSLPKLYAYFGRGNLMLSASLDAFGTLASIVVVPLLMRLIVSDFMPANFEVPFRLVAQEFGMFLVLPLFIGMAMAQWLSKHRERISRWCFCVGTLIVIVMVVGSMGSGRLRLEDHDWQAPAAIIAFCVVSQQLSMMPFRLLGWPRADRLSIGLDVTMRNVNLSLVLLAMMREVLLEQQQALGLEALNEREERVLAGVFWAILFYAGAAAVAGFVVAFQFRYAGPDPNSPKIESDPSSPGVSEAVEAQDVAKENSLGPATAEINRKPAP